MNEHPGSPWLALAFGLGCAAISFACYKLQQAFEANRIMPLSSKLMGDKGIGLLRRTWPFRDKYQYEFARRSMLHLNLLVWKWVLAFVACLLIVIYPIIYLIRFAGL